MAALVEDVSRISEGGIRLGIRIFSRWLSPAWGDLDVGVLWEERPTLDELAGLRMILQDALHFDAIDLITLNNASPILRFEVVSGRPIFCRDAGQRAAFVSLTAREYEDEMAMARWALLFGGASA